MRRILTLALLIFAPMAQAELPLVTKNSSQFLVGFPDKLIPESWLKPASDPEVVESVDFNRYAGLWYDIAHDPNFFQRNCQRSTAEYQVLSPDSVSVHNICYKRDGSTSEIKGVAKVFARETPAKLEVDFGFLRKGDYWIIDLDPDYQWAVVSGPKKKSLFILSRSAPMSHVLLNQILANLKDKGFETDDLVFDEY